MRAVQNGLSMAVIARLHDDVLVNHILAVQPQKRHAEIIRRSGVFYSLAMTPELRRRGECADAVARLKRNVALLSRRTVALALANRSLKNEINQRKEAEETLRLSEQRYSKLLTQSDVMQAQLRTMSHRMLIAQEEERRRISRELHDVISQTLSGINLRLATLKRDGSIDDVKLDANISKTQRMVLKAVEIVHRFARELRPAALDDLGLIPALNAFVGPLAHRSRFRAQIKVCGQANLLNMDQRTVLFRVAQEALNNVARHAKATVVDLSMRAVDGGIRMVIHDNGKAFDASRFMLSSNHKRLGLLGMRERLEMVHGSFEVISKSGLGTSVIAWIPIGIDNIRKPTKPRLVPHP